LYGPDGSTPLTDTNGSGAIDTGVVAMGQAFKVTAKIETPPAAVVGDANVALLGFQSTISPVLTLDATIQSAVPAAFAQTLFEQPSRALSMIVSQPNATRKMPVTDDNWYEQGSTAPALAVAETVPGYFYAWTNLRYIDEIWRAEIEYRLTGKSGDPATGISKLTDHDHVTIQTLDIDPAVAVAPNGNIAVAWYRLIEQPDASKNYNVFLSILDSNGQPIGDAINITNNPNWRADQQPDYDVPAFASPRVAATADDRFLIAWHSSVLTYTHQGTDTIDVDLEDIYYAIYESDGISVTDAVKLSNNIPGEYTRSVEPALAAVDDTAFFITWVQHSEILSATRYGDIYFSVLSSSGAEIEEPTIVIDDHLPNDWRNADVVQLSGGNIIVAWRALGCDGYPWSSRIRYAVFKPNTYKRSGQPACLPPTIVADSADEGVSLVPDGVGRAIVTWTDSEWWADGKGAPRERLYYALLNANGNVATDPMIFYQSRPSLSQLSTGLYGYGSASRIFVDAAIAIDPLKTNGVVGVPVFLDVAYQNLGTLAGTGVIVTATLSSSLTYLGDNAPSAPSLDGRNIVWSLPPLSPWAKEAFTLEVQVEQSTEFLRGTLSNRAQPTTNHWLKSWFDTIPCSCRQSSSRTKPAA
jgi:hypothetical protein